MDSATTNAAYNNNNSNWRNELSQDSRQKIVNKIMDTLQRHMPFTSPDGTNELRKIALRFEEKIYAAAGDQQDYVWKISVKMLSLRNHVCRDGNPLAGGSSGSNQKPLDTGPMMLPQLKNPLHLPALVNGNRISLLGESHPQQALLQQNLKASINGGGMQSSAGLPSTLPSMTNLSQSTSGHVFGTQASHQSILRSAQAPSLQTSQQSLICQSQPSVFQPAQQSNLQQTSESFLEQHQQSLLRQQQSVLQQQPPILQQQQPSIFNVSNMQTQQQQQLQQILQSKNSQYQQAQQPSPSFLQPQSQQLQQQQQQQLLAQLQHQFQQLQQQQPLLPRSISVQQELQQRLHTPEAELF